MKILLSSISMISAICLVGFLFLYGGNTSGQNTSSTSGNHGSAIRVLDDLGEFERVVNESDVPVLIDFFADWCGPCRTQGQILHEMNIDPAQAQVIKVDVDAFPQLARQFNVTSIPKLLVFRDGEVVESHVGLASETVIAEWLNE